MRLLPFGAAISIAALGVAGWSISRADDRLEDLILQNRRSLLIDCAEQSDRIAGIKRTKRALRENPGPLIFGIPRALIKQGLEEDIATRDEVAAILGNACSETKEEA